MCVAVCCSVLQCVAGCHIAGVSLFFVLQCVAVCHIARVGLFCERPCVAGCCSAVRCVMLPE